MAAREQGMMAVAEDAAELVLSACEVSSLLALYVIVYV